MVENENVQKVNFNQFARDIVIPRLTNEEQFEMENDLTMEEIKKVIIRALSEQQNAGRRRLLYRIL